jgi:thiamine monophosphate synthase
MDRPKKAAVEQVERTAHSTSWTAQLREETASSAELHSMALQLRFELIAMGVKQIINDRIGIMLRADPEMTILLIKNDLKV